MSCSPGPGPSWSFMALGAVWLLSGFAMNLGGPVFDAFLADLTEKESRGTVRSMFNSLQNLALLPGPVIGGLLWERVAPAAPFWFGGLLGVLGTVLLLVYLKEPKPRTQAPALEA